MSSLELKLKDLKTILTEKLRFRPEQYNELAVLILNGQEQVIGRPTTPDGSPLQKAQDFVGSPTRVLNVRRFHRMQTMSREGINIQFFIGDYDMLEGGTDEMTVQAIGGYFLWTQSPETQKNLIELYLNYFSLKAQASAEAAGLHLPTSPGGIIPGKVR